MGTHWTDLEVDGRRLTRLIKFLETKMNKCKADDKIIHYAQTIGLLTLKKCDLIKICYSVDDLLKELKVRNSKYEKNRRFD